MSCNPHRWAAASIVTVALACTDDTMTPAAADGAPGLEATVTADADAPAPPDTTGAIDTVSAAEAGADGDAGGPSPTDVAALPACATATDCPPAGPCTLPLCTPKGDCAVIARPDGAACDDGNACTTDDACAAQFCAGAAKPDCDDGNPCTTDGCAAAAGCFHLAAAATTACNDGDPCTAGDTCAAGKCVSGTGICACQADADCGKFDDGNLCTGTMYCDKSAGAPYTCKLNPATIVACSTVGDGPCGKTVCLPATGQCAFVVAPANTGCDDGQACTVGDYCEAGLCKGGSNTCFCKADADCADQEDGDACNGTLFCNKAKGNCELNPATVVTCPTAGNTACWMTLCNPKTGKCMSVAVNEAKPCDDGNTCTPNEACQAGACVSATKTCECQKDADCAAKEDGNPCNGTLYCDIKGNACVVNPATVVHCPQDPSPTCAVHACNPKTAKCELDPAAKNGKACDDGNPCTPATSCQKGVCTATANTCQCQKDADCKAKEDGDLCNGTLYCDLAAGACVVNPATVVQCPKAFDEPCLTNQCNPITGACGIKPANQGHPCGDGGPCSAGGWCAFGVCAVENVQVCACTQDADCAKADDGDLCNGTMYCDKTGPKPTCKVNPATVVVCKTVDDSACAKASCAPKTGTCALQPLWGPCDDGKACTVADACAAGTCAGATKTCGDGNPCTVDACQEPFGCLNTPANATPCDDGNACTTGDACAAGACAGAKALCDDANPCTSDACAPAKGCLFAPNAAGCSDANPCTVGDACAAGLCKAGTVTDCDDADACTTDLCDPLNGACLHLAKPALCDDANPCTTDACSKLLGCTHTANTVACSDGNACTWGDTCQQGVCLPAGLTVCDDANPCTDDSCQPKVGCGFAANNAPCDDGDLCALGQACKAGFCAATKAVNCDDGNVCTDDGCAKTKGCTHTANGQSCDSGACATGNVCKAGACLAGSKVKLSMTQFGTTLGQTKGSWYPAAIVPFANGDLGSAGYYNNPAVGYYAYAARFGPTGAAQWEVDALTEVNAQVTAAATTSDGNLVAVGGNTADEARIAHCNPAGKCSEFASAGWGVDRAIAAHPLGGWWVCGMIGATGMSLRRLDAAYNLLAGGRLTNQTCLGIAVGKDGTTVAVGDAAGLGYVAVVGSNAAIVQSAAVGANYAAMRGVKVRLAGGFLAAGYTQFDNDGSWDGLLVAIGVDGKVAWQRSYPGAGHNVFSAIDVLADGGALLAGATNSIGAGAYDGWLVRVDTWGNVVWQRTFGDVNNDALRAVVVRADVGFAATLSRNTDTEVVYGEAWLLRADAWGNASCAATGLCLGLGFTACDDGDPCTVDTCDPFKGCMHAPFAVGTRCAVDKSCDGSGKCAGGWKP
ncbi:MAG: hypothetical protein FJ100_14705 [Deltaproteobacteria bacterium]|nr:hypothetical protein [Deltaproteobacteria bacterium]